MLFEDRVLYQEDKDAAGPRERLVERWPRRDPSTIWIPSRLLPNRNRRDQTEKSAFHMLQRYESHDFENSFSLYSDSDSGTSDSEEEYFHDYAKKRKTDRPASEDRSSGSAVENGPKSNGYGKSSGPCPLFTDSLDGCPYRNLTVELPETSDGCSGDVVATRLVDGRADHIVPDELMENGFLDCCSDVEVDVPESSDREETTAPVEAEFVYGKKKPREDTFERKVSSKKEKRNKTKAKITMPLDHFWQTVDSDGVPEADEFYESVMRGLAQNRTAYRHVGVNDVHEFPRLHAFPGHGRERAPSVDDEEEVEVSAEGKEAVASAGVGEMGEEEERLGGKVLVMADIPEDVDREMVVALVSDYGQLLRMERVGESLTAEFWIPPDVELDWLISCFDGHQPFGAYSSVLHCYEKES